MATIKNYIDLIREIQKLNPDATIELGSRLEDTDNYEKFFCSVNVNDLKLPELFYVHPKYGITNQTAFSVSEPIFIGVNDINEVKDIKTNDISKVLDSGYTEEEEEYLRKKAEEAQKAAAAEMDKEETKPEETVTETTSRKIDIAGSVKKAGKKVVKTAKKIRCKSVGLARRILNRLDYAMHRTVKPEETEEKVETPTKLQASYNGKTLDDLVIISNLGKKIENDDYMLSLLEAKTGKTVKDELDGDPHGLAETMKDITLVGELHKFAIKDPAYDDATFNLVANTMVNLRHNELYICNRILQQIRYGGVTENQLAFLVDRVNSRGDNFQFDTQGQPAPTRTDDTPVPPTPGRPGGSPSGTPSGDNGGTPSGTSGDTPEENKTDTPEAVVLTEADKRKAEVQKKFSEAKAILYNELGDYEKAFVDDAGAEWLEPGDNEFNQMLNERAVNKNEIFNYYKKVNELKSKMNFDLLDEYEKMFVDDAKAEGLIPGDNEFNMMMGERTVNKERVLNYYKDTAKLTKEMENLRKTMEFFNKNFTEQNVVEPLVDISAGEKNMEELAEMQRRMDEIVNSSGVRSK